MLKDKIRETLEYYRKDIVHSMASASWKTDIKVAKKKAEQNIITAVLECLPEKKVVCKSGDCVECPIYGTCGNSYINAKKLYNQTIETMRERIGCEDAV